MFIRLLVLTLVAWFVIRRVRILIRKWVIHDVKTHIKSEIPANRTAREGKTRLEEVEEAKWRDV